MKGSKSEKVYCIVDKKGTPVIYSCNYTKRDTIRQFLVIYESKQSWPQLKKYGWRCKKFILKPLIN